MGTLPKDRRNDRSGVTQAEHDSSISRRAVLAGTMAATAAAAAVAPIAGSAYAAGPDVNARQDMMAFLLLSAALTGVHVVTLAPEFSLDSTKKILDQDAGVDPINVKNDYFVWIARKEPSAFGKLLQIAKANSELASGILAAVNASTDDTKFLARSIVLLWYLGSWYKPADLKANTVTNGKPAPGKRALTPSEVVSSKAYTQGLVWQIIGAHPMGYSNLQFGYWSRDPNDPNDPAQKSNFGVITATTP